MTDPDPNAEMTTEMGAAALGAPSPLEALLELPRSAREDDLEDFLATVADTVCRTAGFTTVVLNLYRPAWDDYEVALVVGREESVDALMGTAAPRSAFRRIIAEAEQRVPGVYFLAEESGLWNDLDDFFVPELEPNPDPGGWRAGDGVIVFLRDSAGAPLGFVSMDDPTSGRRPDVDDLRLIGVICAHAESALEGARHAERSAEHARILASLLQATPALSRCAGADELLELAAGIIAPGLGFERVAGFLADGDDLVLRVLRGWGSPAPVPALLSVADVDRLLDPAAEQAGCFLGAAAEMFALSPSEAADRSARNGRGSTAWRDHCLAVPCRAAEGELLGLFVIEDPIDRMLPDVDRRRALRLLVDQVAAELVTTGQRRRLRHLATHDPLTGVRNRRGLDETIAAQHGVAVLVCDLDRFKAVNDQHGHARGDEVLARFGDLLRELAREEDVPMRLGGEEFCLILPRTDRDGALAAAERLRVRTAEALAELVPGGLTVSIGVAVAPHGVLDARRLMSAADRGLYAAKSAGRDRVVLVEDPL